MTSAPAAARLSDLASLTAHKGTKLGARAQTASEVWADRWGPARPSDPESLSLVMEHSRSCQ